jgi:hypothetical protein
MPFPTRLKVKISSKFSYPVGAELISYELAGVPQAESLEISFFSKYERIETRGEPYDIFTVSYNGPRSAHFNSGWNITVRPVPRALKPSVKEAMTGEFFPRIRQWLDKHAGLDSKYGGRSLAIVLDEKSEPPLSLREWHTPGEALSS